jgi:hypothetical protein
VQAFISVMGTAICVSVALGSIACVLDWVTSYRPKTEDSTAEKWTRLSEQCRKMAARE